MLDLMKDKCNQSDRLKSAIQEASRADLTSVYRLAYVSRTSPFFGPGDLEEIGRKSAQNNSEADITGILIMDRGKILQILEGEKRSVEALFEKISKDLRHEKVRQVSGSEKGSRLLTCWSLISGEGSTAPATLMDDFHRLHSKLSERQEIEDITTEEVELLKVIALFRAVPL